MKGITRRLLDRIGRRGAALLFFALLDFVYAFAMVNPPRPLTEQYVWMNGVLPLWVWAALWGGVGLLCLVFAFSKHDTVAFTAAMAIKIAWGILAFCGWLAGTFDRGYVSATIWFAFAAFVYLLAGGVPSAPPKPEGARWTRS